MPQEALPFATPSEPDDPVADAIEQALRAAGLRADGGVAVETPEGDADAPASFEPGDADGDDGD